MRILLSSEMCNPDQLQSLKILSLTDLKVTLPFLNGHPTAPIIAILRNVLENVLKLLNLFEFFKVSVRKVSD